MGRYSWPGFFFGGGASVLTASLGLASALAASLGPPAKLQMVKIPDSNEASRYHGSWRSKALEAVDNASNKNSMTSGIAISRGRWSLLEAGGRGLAGGAAGLAGVALEFWDGFGAAPGAVKESLAPLSVTRGFFRRAAASASLRAAWYDKDLVEDILLHFDSLPRRHRLQ